ncbi:hypothetical protein FDC58_14945 [Clostridium botulinum]|uniref:Metal dependent phosphohydrolase n=1 Tax=Clostridium botulinum TaxID=1491 RepID=A0A0A0UY21_CLOBO|nr:hypothetical protein [Clostridium botulinum]AIW54616.1 metal dependent phosphohydrolase [Clostridium botulinum]AIW54735.1 metal dependent phosphohydrolase [Clostridium botulinum]AIW54865.1 metal dependent phosphohydrolase [Clostridium botulinum]MBY7009320.1 hypothetical protein [Clostridium botulinum]NFH74453.1 hypothetical protein [Clostridium botulinum]
MEFLQSNDNIGVILILIAIWIFINSRNAIATLLRYIILIIMIGTDFWLFKENRFNLLKYELIFEVIFFMPILLRYGFEIIKKYRIKERKNDF